MLIAEHGLQGPEIAIHLSDERLDSMNDWCKEHHGQSGLTEKCRASTVSLQQAEEQVRPSLSLSASGESCTATAGPGHGHAKTNGKPMHQGTVAVGHNSMLAAGGWDLGGV